MWGGKQRMGRGKRKVMGYLGVMGEDGLNGGLKIDWELEK
jgi:hypothetical protein